VSHRKKPIYVCPNLLLNARASEEYNISLEDIKKEGIAFFSEAIEKWNRLIQILSEGQKMYRIYGNNVIEANEILGWFQENYTYHTNYSNFEAYMIVDGRKTGVDPVFDVIFRGGNIGNIYRNIRDFIDQLNQGAAHLRGHRSSIRRLESIPKKSEEAPLLVIRKILSRFHLVANQMKRRRKNKTPYLIKDEYDVQILLHALLRLDFDDVRKEDWTPSYAGGASRIDLVLKNEGILVEVKKTSASLKEEQIGKQLIVDIAKYKEYKGVNTLVCFIYDPEQLIENPKGLENDLQKLSTEKLNVEVFVCPRSN